MSYNGEIAANLVDTSTWKKHSALTLDMGDPAAIAFTNTNTWGGGSLIFGVGGTLPAGTYTLNLGIEYSEVPEQWSGTRIICSEKINGKCIVNGAYKDQMGTDSGYYLDVASLPLTFTAENDFAIGFVVKKGAGVISELKLEEGPTASAWQPFLDDASGGGAVMSDDIITLGYNGRGGRILMTNHLAAHMGETCTLSFWTRIDSAEPISKGAIVYPYQSNGIEIAKFPDKTDGSNDLHVTLTEEWQFVEYTGTICQMQDVAGRTAGEMFIWSNANNGGPSIQLAGIALTLAGGGASMSSTGRNLATNSKALSGTYSKNNRIVGRYTRRETLAEREDGFAEVVTGGKWQGIGASLNQMYPESGAAFTMSADVRNDRETNATIYAMMMCFNSSGTRVYPPFSMAFCGSPATSTTSKTKTLAPGEELRAVATCWLTDEAAALVEGGGSIAFTLQANGSSVAYWAPKLEYGTAATPWRAAPEDTEQPSDVVYASEGVDLGDTSGLATDADARGYASDAQAAATAAAAADATAKANDAKKYATNYIALDPVNGIRIADANPDTATTYQKQTSTSTEFFVDGESRLKVGGDGQRIGKAYVQGATDNESHMEQDYHSLQMVDKEGNTYFHVSDLRDSDGVVTLVDRRVGDGRSAFVRTSVPFKPRGVRSITVNGSSVTFVYQYEDYQNIELAQVPANGAEIVITYDSEYVNAKAYTLGTRKAGYDIGMMSHATGEETVASGYASDASNLETRASGAYSHAEGQSTIASGSNGSHAEGYGSKALGLYGSHAEGVNSEASGTNGSHAEGHATIASGGNGSHAEGYVTEASGAASHAQNVGTIAASRGQTALGRFNVEDTNETYALIVGNGTADNDRSNAHTLDWQGNAWYAGDVTDGTGNVLSDKADAADLPTKTSDLTNDSGFLTSNDVGDVASDDVVPIAHGGTNATSASAARTNLGLGSLATKSTLTIEHTTIESTSAKNSSAVASGGNVNFTCNCTVPSGYIFAGIQRVGRTGGAGLVLLGYDASDTGNTATLSFRNMASSSIAANTASATCEFRFIKATVG